MSELVPEKYVTAIHEAGHAVIGRALGVVCGGASIKADAAGHSLTADPHITLSAWDRQQRWRGQWERSAYRGRVLAFMAGAEAEREIVGYCRGGDGDDRLQIAMMLNYVDDQSREDRMRALARMLVRRHRASIERVADVLLEKTSLSGGEIDALLPKFVRRPDTAPVFPNQVNAADSNDSVKVHRFLVWDEGEDEYVVPPRKSTEERIQRIHGEILPNTEEEVDRSALDPQGRYDPNQVKDNDTTGS